jgi:hypothetical protein
VTIGERIASDPAARENRGSRARCLLLTDRERAEVAAELTRLTDGWAVVDPLEDFWRPRGSENTAEAKIGETPGFVPEPVATELVRWWLAVPASTHGSRRVNIPNWDIASTAHIAGRKGLLLVEAKAHAGELGEAGKELSSDASPDSIANHQRIGAAIQVANNGLEAATGLIWRLSRDSHYQLANRFAWSWKIASLGIPVALLYLGFIDAVEMDRNGRRLIGSQKAWEGTVKRYAKGAVSERAWETTIQVPRQPQIDAGAPTEESTPMRAIIKAIRLDISRALNPR